MFHSFIRFIRTMFVPCVWFYVCLGISLPPYFIARLQLKTECNAKESKISELSDKVRLTPTVNEHGVRHRLPQALPDIASYSITISVRYLCRRVTKHWQWLCTPAVHRYKHWRPRIEFWGRISLASLKQPRQKCRGKMSFYKNRETSVWIL